MEDTHTKHSTINCYQHVQVPCTRYYEKIVLVLVAVQVLVCCLFGCCVLVMLVARLHRSNLTACLQRLLAILASSCPPRGGARLDTVDWECSFGLLPHSFHGCQLIMVNGKLPINQSLFGSESPLCFAIVSGTRTCYKIMQPTSQSPPRPLPSISYNNY
jgi:hypothetical protein